MFIVFLLCIALFQNVLFCWYKSVASIDELLLFWQASFVNSLPLLFSMCILFGEINIVVIVVVVVVVDDDDDDDDDLCTTVYIIIIIHVTKFFVCGLVGDVGLSVTDPQGRDVPVTTDAMKNNAFKIGFQPTQPGVYEANVYFGDQQVPGSPFQVRLVTPRAGKWLRKNLRFLNKKAQLTQREARDSLGI